VDEVTPIRVIVGEDHPIFLKGLEWVIASHPSAELVGVAASRDAVLALAASEQVDVILTDLRMPPAHRDEGLQIAQRMRSVRPAVGVILLSQFAEPSVVMALVQDDARARGYMLKDRIADPLELVHAIERVAIGGTAIDRELVDMLVAGTPGRPDPLGNLGEGERDVIALIAEGLTNEAIAQRLGIGVSAVEKRIGSLFRALPLGPAGSVHRRVAATLYYLERTSGPPPPG